jgi:hypothetical protein
MHKAKGTKGEKAATGRAEDETQTGKSTKGGQKALTSSEQGDAGTVVKNKDTKKGSKQPVRGDSVDDSKNHRKGGRGSGPGRTTDGGPSEAFKGKAKRKRRGGEGGAGAEEARGVVPSDGSQGKGKRRRGSSGAVQGESAEKPVAPDAKPANQGSKKYKRVRIDEHVC